MKVELIFLFIVSLLIFTAFSIVSANMNNIANYTDTLSNYTIECNINSECNK